MKAPLPVRVTGLLSGAAMCLVVTACSGQTEMAPAASSVSSSPLAAVSGTASQSIPAAGTDVEAGPAEAVRKALEGAYNSLPNGEPLGWDAYQQLWQPVWDVATQQGFSLTRMPVEAVDGFALTDTESVLPGHALITEAVGEAGTFCIVASDAANPSLLTTEQALSAQGAPREFLALEGSCEVHVTFLEGEGALQDPTG